MVNMDLVNVSVPLKLAHFPFDRANDLAKAMTWCVTDYYRNALIGGRFEARGVMVVGESRQGKSTEIDKYLANFNDGTTLMPDGRPAKIVSCLLSGKVTWKSLGVEILEVLGYPLKGQHRQSDIWPKVRKIAKLQGVVGIHFDECQHVFNETDGVTNKKMLDSFKSLLKDPHWPMMLIFSGVPSLAKHINKEEQLAFLLRTVSFDGIDLSRETDFEQLVQLVFSYGDRAQLEFDDFAMEDFLERLAFSACHRWGLVIELLIEAFSISLLKGDKVCKIDHFSEAFSNITSAPPGYSPFTMPNYQDHFDQGKLIELYEKTRQKKAPKSK
jgi:hypothetical protein